MATHYVSSPNSENIDATIAISSNNQVNVIKPSSYYTQTGAFASKPYDGDDAAKAVIGYDFANDDTGFAFQRSKAAFPAVSALENASGYPEYVNSINKSESVTTVKTASAIRSGNFNIYTGKFKPTYPNTSTDSFGNDNAARSSYDIPGSLTFMTTGSNPVSQNYEAKG